MSKPRRYQVVEGSTFRHNPVEAQVVDTTRRFKWEGKWHFEAVCQCTDKINAELIRDALNTHEEP